MSHIDPKKFIGSLTISPDIYECNEVYDAIYEIYGGALDENQFTNIGEQVDEIYRALYDKLTKAMKLKHATESYILHRWINETTAIVGSVNKTSITRI